MIGEAVASYRRDVKERAFPAPEHGYNLPDEGWRAFLASVGTNLHAVPVAR